MTMFEILLRLTHDCPFANLSRRFPDVKMFLWCNRHHEIMEFVTHGYEDIDGLLEAAASIGTTVEHFSDCGNIHAVTKDCQCTEDNSVSVLFDSCNLLQISPVVYMEGWEHYRLVAFKQSHFSEMMRLLDKRGIESEILRKVPFDGFIASSLTLTADALFSDLTDKQIDALLTAYTNGYYQIPRGADVRTISRKADVVRTTFQEHLRKAENKLVAALVPYLELFRKAPESKREEINLSRVIESFPRLEA